MGTCVQIVGIGDHRTIEGGDRQVMTRILPRV